MRVHGKEPPHIMHQNNKGKPAPNQAGVATNVSLFISTGCLIWIGWIVKIRCQSLKYENGF